MHNSNPIKIVQEFSDRLADLFSDPDPFTPLQADALLVVLHFPEARSYYCCTILPEVRSSLEQQITQKRYAGPLEI